MLVFSWKDLTSWNPSCSLRVSPMDQSLSIWCLTPCWPTTLGALVWRKLLVELMARGPTSSTASSSPLKQALTGRHCSWNYIIGITEECLSPWNIFNRNRNRGLGCVRYKLCYTFLQIYTWILLLHGGPQQPEGLSHLRLAPAGAGLPAGAGGEGVWQCWASSALAQ